MEQEVTLIIADDEQYVIDNLLKHIDWKGLNINVVGTATNGQEGVKQALLKDPDLILTDVCMPEIDGISMIGKLYDMGRHPFVLIFSGYDDFEYAKRAISYGISDYLLKPSLPEEITAALKKMADKCRIEKQRIGEQAQLKMQFERNKTSFQTPFCNALLKGEISTYSDFSQQDLFLGTNLLGKNYIVVEIHMNPIKDEFGEETIEQQMFALFQVTSYASTLFLTPERSGINFGFANGTEYLLVAGTKTNLDNDLLLEEATRLLDYCTKIHQLSVVIALSDIVSDFSKIADCYQQVKAQVRFCDIDNIVLYPTRASEKKDDRFLTIPLMNKPDVDAIIDAVKAGSSEKVLILLKNCFEKIRNLPKPQDLYIYPILYGLLGETLVWLLQMGIDYDYDKLRAITVENRTFQEMEEKTMDFFASLMQHLQHTQLTQNQQLIQQMITLMKEHYRDGITLNEIANMLHFTPNYLSTIFAKSTGDSFSGFTAHYRIQKAKELLDTGQYKVYEIGDLVGYKNPEYFTKVFKDIVGVSPSAYKK